MTGSLTNRGVGVNAFCSLLLIAWLMLSLDAVTGKSQSHEQFSALSKSLRQRARLLRSEDESAKTSQQLSHQDDDEPLKPSDDDASGNSLSTTLKDNDWNLEGFGSGSGDLGNRDDIVEPDWSNAEDGVFTTSNLPQGYCYCKVDYADGGFHLSEETCQQSLYARARDSTSGLKSTAVDTFYSTDQPDQAARDFLIAFLKWDCQAAPPCQCRDVADVAALIVCARAIKQFEPCPKNRGVVTDFVATAAGRVLEASFQAHAHIYIPWVRKWAQAQLPSNMCDTFAAWPGPYRYMRLEGEASETAAAGSSAGRRRVMEVLKEVHQEEVSEVVAGQAEGVRTMSVATPRQMSAADINAAMGERVESGVGSGWPRLTVVVVMGISAALLVALPAVLMKKRNVFMDGIEPCP